jgi:hypothetical protein
MEDQKHNTQTIVESDCGLFGVDIVECTLIPDFTLRNKTNTGPWISDIKIKLITLGENTDVRNAWHNVRRFKVSNKRR